MANLVSNEYYEDTWLGTEASSETELTKMLSRAEDMIREKATKKITEANVNDYVKKAICAQAEYLISGAYESMNDGSTGVSSAKLGEFSYTEKDKGQAPGINSFLHKMVEGYLRQGGFYSAVLCRGY